MRIVHDVECPMASIAGFDNGRVKLFATVDSHKNHPDLHKEIFEYSESIEIEGDETYITKMLEDWLKLLKSCKKYVNADISDRHLT